MSLKPPKGMIDESDPKVTLIGHPAPAWMVNYADLMTELVCFWLIMYALSTALSKPVQEAKKEVEEAMKKEEVAADVKITKDGLQISIQEQGTNVFFMSGSADLTDNMKKILDTLTPTLITLAEKRHEVIVEGHTDAVPIHTTRFDSNWELSTARATSVVRYLVREKSFPPKRIAAIGYGDNKNIARTPDEDTAAWNSKNRRVVFLVKNPQKEETEPVAEVSDATAPPAHAAPAEKTEEPSKE